MMKTKHETTKSLSYFPSSSSTLSIINLLCCLTFLTLPTSTLSTILHSNETDRIALLDFKHRISHDPREVLLNSWNDSVHHCRWQGVSCGRRHQRVVALRLPEKGLVGTISPHIGNLTFRRDFNLSGNGLYGQVPSEIGKLLRLRSLNLFANALTGELAGVNLSSCVRLEQIVISRNGLHGRLPVRLSSLKKLRSLRLGRNHFTGGIPPSFGNLSSLQFLGLDENHLGGSVPNEISELWGLNILLLDANNLTGTLSSSLFNITSVRVISITDNSL
ncbi:LRR receptor-like serine/threonine-protein kinase EFR [Ipomoea triloba]|uniref:LRR receptor-like serine/threonine-protein kinase EFR n=1 Tax=Ipomoea triloba TaxID=35885 RepID=UPI00125E71D0|nr:LRR receptor-like serine/threonine-protein kinase EFR [Ipomoea triloba]